MWKVSYMAANLMFNYFKFCTMWPQDKTRLGLHLREYFSLSPRWTHHWDPRALISRIFSVISWLHPFSPSRSYIIQQCYFVTSSSSSGSSFILFKPYEVVLAMILFHFAEAIRDGSWYASRRSFSFFAVFFSHEEVLWSFYLQRRPMSLMARG